MRILLFLAACAVSLVAVSSTGAADGQLVGSVGPGFTIFLKDSSGVAVTHLDTGTYTLVVHDLSDEHDFHLSGPGVDVLTDVEFVGDKTFTITVKDGTYNYVCDPHSPRMHGQFTVGSTLGADRRRTRLPTSAERACTADRARSEMWSATDA